MDYNELKQRIGGGLLSFPVTPFTADLSLDAAAYSEHVAWLDQYDAAALFAAGGTGEFFSMTADEVAEATRLAKDAARSTPIIAGCGYGSRMAMELAQRAEQAGADALLLLPHYLIRGSQEGLFAHAKSVCDSTRLGVIIYNRDNAVYKPETVARLADACPNLIGFKDGVGDVDLVRQICATVGDRLVYVGGMPTHELFAEPYFAAGVTTYSSAVFNFIPEMALNFYAAVRKGDRLVTDQILKEFFFPYAAVRDRGVGYAVSIVKAGMRVIGRDCGPVRPPLTDLTPEEHEMLGALVKNANAKWGAAA